MINDWKLGMKMLRYGYGIKLNCVMGGVIIVLAIAAIALGGATGNNLPAGYMLLVVGLLPVQVLVSLNITGMVQASPCKKKLQTSVPALITFSIMTLVYLVDVLASSLMILIRPQSREWMGESLFIMAILLAVTMVYTGVAYKYFWLASLCMIPIICIGLTAGLHDDRDLLDFLTPRGIVFWQAALSGLVILAAGALGQYLVSLLVYKVPLDKMGQAAPLRKLM